MPMQGKAVLLLNLGSPASTAVGDVRRYLREFLSDERVIDTSAAARWAILNLFILPFRPKRSAAAYRKIWGPEGSPLLVMSRRQQELLGEETDLPVALAMRYGEPSIADTLESLIADGLKELFIMPLYPQYAMSSYETVLVRVMEEIKRHKREIETAILQPFYEDPAYIEAVADSMGPYLKEDYDKLLFSFHGIPEHHLRKTDPSHAHCLEREDCCRVTHPAHATCYRHQCFRMVEKIVARAGIPRDRFSVSFQSRLGRRPWLKPYTDLELERLARNGVKNLLVTCPAFVTDCLETLEEIAIRGKEIFEGAGGERLTHLPCLNDHPSFIRFLKGKIEGWRNSDNGFSIS